MSRISIIDIGDWRDARLLIDCVIPRFNRLLAYHDTNDHNCNKICAMLSLFAEFTAEFESSCAIILQQLFASSSVNIVA